MKTLPVLGALLFLLVALVATAHGDVIYHYDNLGRLITAGGGGEVVTFSYDTVGNINSDSDGDGLTDADEVIHQTLPQDPDSDGDAMADGWEVANGLNPTLSDAAGDADDDGFSNGEEYASGTDPWRMPLILVDFDSPAWPGDGKSWPTAFATLQDALLSARLKAEIWLAAGLYLPDQGGGKIPGDRGASFELKNGVALYGGFSGSETALSQRDFARNLTILSGDLAEPGIATDNSYHVVTSTDNDATAILDGVVISDGNAEVGQPYPDSYGGGLLIVRGAPVIKNTTLTDNMAECGGGLAAMEASPLLINIACTGNVATFGGGLASVGGSPTITNGIIADNTASFGGGGYLGVWDHAAITATRITDNHAYVGGGAWVDSGFSTMDRSGITRNTAESGAGIWGSGSSLFITNTVFDYNDAAVSGGAMLLANEDRSIFLNDDFLYNTAGTTGDILLAFSNSGPTVINSILWDNDPPTDDRVVLKYGSSVSITYSHLKDGSQSIVNHTPDWGGTITYANNIEPPAAPQLSEDFHLLFDSPCIDRGDPVTVPPAGDIDGESRPKGTRVDIGMDEYY